MALSLWNNYFIDPFAELNRMQTEMDNFFQSMSLDTQGPASSTIWRPRIDVTSNDKEYTIKAELPGCKKEDINLELRDGFLTLSGKRQHENNEENEKYHRQERYYGSFTRSFGLPDGVSETDVKATFDNGILEVNILKPQHEESKKITID